MRTTFFGIEIARKALYSYRTALDVTSHNVANAQTKGFSRQEVTLAPTSPFTVPSITRLQLAGQVGTGVVAQKIQRMRDGFLDEQVRNEQKRLGESLARRDVLREVEGIMNEISESGLRTVFDRFWESLQDLVNTPESFAVREHVRQRALALTDCVNHLHQQLWELQLNLDDSVRKRVGDINLYAEQIAALNNQIVRVEATGDRANDLRDMRDLLVEDLSKLATIKVVETPVGAYIVTLGGSPLVSDDRANVLSIVDNPANNNFADVYWRDLGVPAEISSGELRGFVDGRDVIVSGYMASLDSFVNVFVQEVNIIHQAGFGLDGSTGLDFFDPAGTTARTFRVDPAILADVRAMAAASLPNAPGDGSNALKLAQLRSTPLIGGSTLDDYFRLMVSSIGVEMQEAERVVTSQTLLLDRIDNERQSLSSVSLDDEMIDMVKYQQAYNAAARLVTTFDEMIDTIVNRMGIVGR